jgi:hypothetical protein
MKSTEATVFDRKSGAAEGPAVRPDPRTRVSVPLVLPQNRHPVRSASPIDCVTQRLWRGVEGPRRCLSYPFCSEFSTTEARQQDLLRYALDGYGYRWRPRPVRAWWLKSSEQHGQNSTAEVLRLRATSAVSRDRSVRRSAQDDDSVGVSTKKRGSEVEGDLLFLSQYSNPLNDPQLPAARPPTPRILPVVLTCPQHHPNAAW